MTSRSRSSRRLAYVGFWTALVLMAMRPAAQQAESSSKPFFVPGRNVNTLGPTPAGPNPMLAGNPKHKQRNEASCDVSPANPLVVLCANNDYRGVEVFGDSWIGLSMSTDGARTWRDRLLDEFPEPGSGIGAADPVVRTVPGLGLVAYITLSRADGRGTLSLAVLHERNKENGEPYQFYQKRLIGSGTPGRFQDKPAMLAVLDLPPKAGAPNDTVDVGGRPIPKGTVHYAYSLFPGTENNSSSQIYHTLSKDYGLTWSQPKKLSESLGINQGVDLAYDETTNTLVAVWRQVADNNQADAIVFARSGNGGQTWSKPQVLWAAAAGQFFDQDTAALQFRTRSMPSIVHDGTAFRVFWSARGFPDAVDARIVVRSSTDGLAWPEGPTAIAPYAGHGHQIIPQAAVAGGRLQVDWIDTRNNESFSFGRSIADFKFCGDENGSYQGPPDASGNCLSPKTFVYRQMGDIYAVQATVGGTLNFSDARSVSRYRFGVIDGRRRQLEYSFLNAKLFQKGMVPFHGDYHAIASQRYRPSETTAGKWVTNTSPSTSHAVFYSAFTDNRDIQGYVWDAPNPSPFTPAGGTLQGESGAENATPCNPTAVTPEDPVTTWTPGDSPRSRYQNIYAAVTLPELVVSSPSGSKPVGGLARAYVVFVQNLTTEDRDFQFTVSNQLPDAPPSGTGRVSFRLDDLGVPDTSCVDGSNCQTINVTIPRGSSATRTVYVRSTTPRPRITVAVNENGGDNLQGSVILNADPNVSPLENPDYLGDVAPYDIGERESYQPDLLTRQLTPPYWTDVVNPDVTPVTVEEPRIEFPRIEFPRIEFPRIEFPRIEFPRIEFPRIEFSPVAYPRIEFSGVQNPRIEFSPLAGDDTGVMTTPTQVTEISWPVTTGVTANTVTGMTSQVFVNGTIPLCNGTTITQNCVSGAQLLVSVPQFYTVARSCSGAAETVVENQVIVNHVIVDPAALKPVSENLSPDTVNPADLTQPTFFVGPKQVAFVTLRLFGRFDETFANRLSGRTGIIVRSQPDKDTLNDRDDARDGTVDLTAPTFDANQAIDYSPDLPAEATSAAGANVSFTTPVATDNAGPVSVVCTPASGSLFPIGKTVVTCVATDAAGNSTSSSHLVTVEVRDSTPPVIDMSGLAETVRLTPTMAGMVLTYDPTVVKASDIVWGNLTSSVTCAPPNPTTLQAGPAAITCTVQDGSGNSANAAYTFTVAKAATTTTVTAANATYDGSPHGATASVTGPGGFGSALPVTYSGTSGTSYGPTVVPPTNAGTYLAAATFDGNPGYAGSTGSATFTIGKAPTTTTVSCPAMVAYTGAPQTPCSATVTGAGGLSQAVAVTYVNNTDGGTATASASYPGDANYSGSSGSATFAIVRVTAQADPKVLLWSPNKTMTPVTVSGVVTSPGIATVIWAVTDEYGKVQPTGSASVGPNGAYSFTVSLEAYRNGTDSDGRLYTITVTAMDGAGRAVTATTTQVRVPHNQ